jgi:hypothetical protein
LEVRAHECLPRLASNHSPPDLSLPIARMTGVSHWCLTGLEFLRNMVVILQNYRILILLKDYLSSPLSVYRWENRHLEYQGRPCEFWLHQGGVCAGVGTQCHFCQYRAGVCGAVGNFL